MPKIYKHKQTLWVAEEFDATSYYILDTKTKIQKELIEDSLDWESQTEKDWIDRVLVAIGKMQKEDLWEQKAIDIRQIIEKYLPMISREDVSGIYGTKPNDMRNGFIEVAKEKGLYKY